MSKPSLTGREQQQSSPFGLGHKQTKKAKKIKKYGANAPYLHPIRCYIDFCVMLCNEQAKKQKNTAQTRHICTIFFLRDERVLNMQEVKIVGRGVDTRVINVCYANERFQPVKQELAKGVAS